jgi:DNA polymerase III delta prime subunit
MAHHAYFVVGESEEGILRARGFASGILGSNPQEKNADLHIFNYGLFTVDDARALATSAWRAPDGNKGKVLIISVTRIFHEAQNALLKLFEEPPQDVTLILIIPSEGLLLPTLRSRLLPLANTNLNAQAPSSLTAEFLVADKATREKIIAKLLERAKSDKDEEKQAARSAAIQLVEGLMHRANSLRGSESLPEETELLAFLDDCQHFLPILHERSAPLKLIWEHLLLVTPKTLT